MRLVVKRGERTVNEFQFAKGPIYIGRHANSQIFLPDRVVSRHHAVIFGTQDGKWVVEDLDSANKTYLNNKAIHKAEIKTGDIIRIIDFTIEVGLEEQFSDEQAVNLEDTLTKTAYGLDDTLSGPVREQVVVRKPDSEHAPNIKLPAKRAKDFLEATEAICKAGSIDKMLLALLGIATRQFTAFHVWCALRDQPTGPMTYHTGETRDGEIVELSDIKLNEKITEAIEKNQYMLLERVPTQVEAEKIRSAMIAPFVSEAGCFGVIYVDNALDREHYGLGDLDYLMLLAIHTAAILKNY